MDSSRPQRATAAPGNNPYSGLPATSRWKDSVSGRPARQIDPTLPGRFQITAETRIASAGSCFAQTISEELRQWGYRYLNLESGAPFLTDEARHRLGYDIYSARYGNIYTAAQLLQLFQRASGSFTPKEEPWGLAGGGIVDPFRPGVQPGGSESEQECLDDRKAHLQAVQRVFAELDIFIFTLGLTEAWLSSVDGAVFPVVPGSGLGGTFNPSIHQFKNFSAAEVAGQLSAFIDLLAAVNPNAKIILTVSPVPLIATFEDRHVLQSTVYSKSVLRVTAEEMKRKYPHVDYFPSYEIVASLGGSSFEDDRRTVARQALTHVMECFRRQFLSEVSIPTPATSKTPASVRAEPMCDEDAVLAALAREADAPR